MPPDKMGILNASGYPVKVPSAEGIVGTKSRWISIRGRDNWNVYVEGADAATSFGAKVNASMDGQVEHEDGFVASLTKSDMTANIQVDKPVPFIQIEVTGGVVTSAFVYASG